MTLEEILARLEAKPFAPFTVSARDGRSLTVYDPARVKLLPSGMLVLDEPDAKGVHQRIEHLSYAICSIEEE